LTFFEVGLGDAILVQFPGGRSLLVDAGIGWRTEEILAGLEARGIDRLDGLLLTHAHADHYRGMERILDQVPVGTFYYNGVRPRRSSFERLERALAARGTPLRVIRRGDRFDELSGPEVLAEVIYPDREAMDLKGNLNHGSIVLRLTHGSVRFLLTGDAEKLEEDRLLALEGEDLCSEVLKLGHHASPGSGRSEFLRAVRPQVAVAMGTGIPNIPLFYPRPNYRIRRVLKEEGTLVLTTRKAGVVEITSDGDGLEVWTGDRKSALAFAGRQTQVASR
jgi:competence protein ComEC